MNFRYDPKRGVTVEAETGLRSTITGFNRSGRTRFLVTTGDGRYWFGFEAGMRCRPSSPEEISMHGEVTQVCTWLVHLYTESNVPPADFTDEKLRRFVTGALKEHERRHPRWRTTTFDVAFVEQ